MPVRIHVVRVAVDLALVALLASGCMVERAGVGRIGVDGGVGARDGGRRDAGVDPGRDGGMSGEDGATTPGDDAAVARDAGPPIDAGVVTPDAGPAPNVTFEVRVDGTLCPALASCDGTLEGTWQVSGGCVDFTQVNSLRSACAAATVSGTGTARGRVSFAAGTMTRSIDIDWRGTVNVPVDCARLIGGCGIVQSTIQDYVPGAAVSCPGDGAGGCACTLTIGSTLADAFAYRIEGNQFVRVDTGRRWEYCVSGSSLRYRETTGTLEPGTFAFTPL
jgi:hypothetical protein